MRREKKKGEDYLGVVQSFLSKSIHPAGVGKTKNSPGEPIKNGRGNGGKEENYTRWGKWAAEKRREKVAHRDL